MGANVGKNTLYLTAASIGQKLLAFVYFLFLARVMGTEHTGEYFLALSITTIFSTITDFGLTSVVIRDIARFPEQSESLIRRALWFKVPLMFLAVVGSIGTAWALGYDRIIIELVAVATLVMLADAISLLFYGILRGNHLLKYESVGIFIGQGFTLLFGGTTLVLFPSLHALVFALLFGSAFNMCFSVWRVVRLLGPGILKPVWDNGHMYSLLRAALPFALAGIFVKIYSYVDSVFISKMIGTAAVGVYAVAYKFTYAFQFLPMAFVAALYPGMSSLIGRDASRLRQLFDDAIWYVAVLAVPIAFGLFAIAPDAVALAGGGYANAVPVLQTLVFVLIPIFLDFPIGSLLNAAGRQAAKTTVMGLTVILNVLLNAFLIPAFGIVGAAFAALVSFTFLMCGGLYFVPQIIKGYSFVSFARIVLPIFFSGAAMGILAYFLRPIIGFVLTIPVAAVAYAFLLVATRSVRTTHARAALRLISRRPSYAKDAPLHD